MILIIINKKKILKRIEKYAKTFHFSKHWCIKILFMNKCKKTREIYITHWHFQLTSKIFYNFF